MTITISSAGAAGDTHQPTHAAACSCGQQLDCCDRAHCPRCGCAIDQG